jgi:hypothetical protein
MAKHTVRARYQEPLTAYLFFAGSEIRAMSLGGPCLEYDKVVEDAQAAMLVACRLTS